MRKEWESKKHLKRFSWNRSREREKEWESKKEEREVKEGEALKNREKGERSECLYSER